MSDDVKNPVQPLPGKPAKPVDKDVYVVGDRVAVYGGDQGLSKYFEGDHGQVRKTTGNLLQVALIPKKGEAQTLSTLTFHVKQVRKLKVTDIKEVWLDAKRLDEALDNGRDLFDIAASFNPKTDPEWRQYELKTVVYVEE